MEDVDDMPISKNTKILFNLLQIRIFDLSQALQVSGHKLSINQVKQTLQKQYNIFGQIQKIFDELKMHKLYDLMKQVSQNYISISSILIDEKSSNFNAAKKRQCMNVQNENYKSSENKTNQSEGVVKSSPRSSNRKKSLLRIQQQSIASEKDVQQAIDTIKKQSSVLKNKLGGINLYNQNYYRGIQSLQKKYQALEMKKKKHYDEKQLIRQLIYKQISDQADVQKISENDEISKFIKQGKIKHQLYNHIQYEKDLQSISSFLKQSQDDALKFLTDSKKVNQQDTDEDIIINYHELIQILAQKKKSQYQIVENKIKQIVDNFKLKIVRRQQKIKDLQYKLKRKQGKQHGTQTLGFRSKFNTGHNSQDTAQQMEQQNKAVIQLLKRNLDQNQKQLLILETDVRGRDQKIKKKDIEINNLYLDIQKLKKSLKQEKQKSFNLSKGKDIDSTHIRNSIDKPIDLNIDKADLQSVYGNQAAEQENFSKGNRKRKQKHSFFGNHSGNHSNSVLSMSKLVKSRQDSILSSGFAQTQARRLNSFAALTNNHFYKTQVGIKKYQDLPSNDRYDDLNTSRKQLFVNQTTHRFADDKYEQISGEPNLPFNENKQISHKLQTQVRSITLEKESNIQLNLKPDDQKKANQQNVVELVKNNKKPTQPQQKLSGFINDKIAGNSSNQSQSFFSTNALLQKNTQTLYDILFNSVPSNDGKILQVDQQIRQLKQFIGKYNQRQLHSRLRRMISFLNLNQNSDCQQIVQKQVSQQQDSLQNCSHRLDIEDHIDNKSHNRDQNDLTPGRYKNQQRLNRVFRKKQIKTDLEKWEKQKPIDLQKLKEKKQLKKIIPSNSFLKKLHQQMRVSGKGFNLTKKQFIQICKNIHVQQSLRNSQNNSITDSDDQVIVSSSQRPTTFQRYKNKQNLMTQYTQRQEVINRSNQKLGKLKIQGTGIDVNHESYKLQKEKQKQKEKQRQIQKQRSQKTHRRKQSQSLNNLQKVQKLPKSHTFSISKQLSHQIRQTPSPKKVQNQKITNLQQKLINLNNEQKHDKKKQVKQFYKILKSQGARIQSVHKLEEIMEINKLSLEDIIKITVLLKSDRHNDIAQLFSNNCQHTNVLQKSNVKNTINQPCCSHANKYSAFLQKMSINEQTLRKMRKDAFSLHVLNIDGKSSQKDFYKKKLTKQTSSKFIDVTNISETKLKVFEKYGQAQSFHVNSKKQNQKSLNDKQLVKKATVSSYQQGKQRNYTQNLDIDRKSYRNHQQQQVVGFLPQLTMKGMTQLIKN